MKNKLTAMETFVGAGGSYLGLKKAGFKTIYVNEIDKNFTKTLTHNNKKDLEKCIVDVKPIEEVNFQKLRNKLNIKKKKLDLIFGGPVCKGYSLAGVRDPSDIRNTLYRHQIRMIAEFLPKISIIENVPAMRTSLILKSGIKKDKLKEISYIWKQLDIFKGLKAKLTKKGKGFSKVELNNYNLIKSKKKKYEDFVKNNSISVIDDISEMLRRLGYKIYIEKLKEISYIWKQLDIFKGLKAKLTKEGKGFSKVELKNYNLIKSKKKKYEDFVKNNSISVIDDISEMLRRLGYKIYIENLNAAWFGSYTKRVRTFVVAVRKDIKKEFIFPTITNFDYKTKLNGFNIVKDPKPFKTIKEAFKELDYKGINSPKNDLDNAPMNHNEKSVQRFKLIPKGKNIVDVMDKVPRDLKISKFYSRGCTMRLDDNSPSPTLVPGHSNFPVHPYEHRSISVREAAQITGFPSNYKFFGNHTKRCEQVGNAVPIPLAFALANQCKKIL